MHPFDVVILSHSDSNHDIILVLDLYDVNNVILKLYCAKIIGIT